MKSSGGDSATTNLHRCPFCGSGKLTLAYAGLYNRRKPDFGPFDFYHCDGCGSAITIPPPSPEELAKLYQQLDEGLSALSRELLAGNPEAAWHRMCLEHMSEFSGLSEQDEFRWIDVGAGAGEMAAALARKYPQSSGYAIDIHDRPARLAYCGNVQWVRIDPSNDDFTTVVPKAELVFAVGVWEHVRHPDTFVRNAIRAMADRSTLYMVTPNYGSAARRVMGQRWPYFFPGEHIGMPSVEGARACLARELSAAGRDSERHRILVRPTLVTYSMRYVFAKFGMRGIAKLCPPRISAKLPSGALEAVLWLEPTASGG